MIAPTPGPASSQPAAPTAEATNRPEEAPAVAVGRSTPDWSSPEARARDMLERLGRGDHPDAESDPIHALYQVAVDFRCSAHGYRELYLHRMRTKP